jgi:hypothetical protein
MKSDPECRRVYPAPRNSLTRQVDSYVGTIRIGRIVPPVFEVRKKIPAYDGN